MSRTTKKARGATDGLSPETTADSRPGPPSRLERIARRAHEIYEARGAEDGKSLEDWLAAEREIDAQS